MMIVIARENEVFTFRIPDNAVPYYDGEILYINVKQEGQTTCIGAFKNVVYWYLANSVEETE